MGASSSKYFRWGVILGAMGLVLSVWVIMARPAAVVRFATFDVSLTRGEAGQLARDLAGDDLQARAVAEIIQRVAPDVLLLCGFDDDSGALDLFTERYLGAGQNGAPPIAFSFRFAGPDDRSGRDGMVVLSRYPILTGQARTFGGFPWQAMPSPGGDPEGALSSRGHWDVPVQLSDSLAVHVLACYPRPPAEDAKGRNHDEIRFWADYVASDRAGYALDDAGARGGLATGAPFVIMGNLNVDPADGDRGPRAIAQLLEHPRVQSDPAPRSEGAVQQYRRQWGVNADHTGDASTDTADFDDVSGPGNLRVDYVLPSSELQVDGAGVFWPEQDHPWFAPVGVEPFPASAHRLVWIDVRVE